MDKKMVFAIGLGILLIGIIVYQFIPLFTQDWNGYWEKRFETQSDKLNSICEKEFGEDYKIEMQTPSHFSCCKSFYPNICEQNTETYELNRPHSMRDTLMRLKEYFFDNETMYSAKKIKSVIDNLSIKEKSK